MKKLIRYAFCLVIILWGLVAQVSTAYGPGIESPPASISQNFIVSTGSPITPKTIVLTPSVFTYCSCVEYAKAMIGYVGSLGNARDIKPNTDYPFVGGLVLLNEGQGHVAVITKISGTQLYISEANYSRCQKTTRVIDTSYVGIRGYWVKP